MTGASPTVQLFAWLLAALAAATLFALPLARCRDARARRLAGVFTARLRGWWAMTGILLLALLTGGFGSILVFALTSFLLLREFITMTPTRRGDHRALFWAFMLIPLQYGLLASGWYGLFSILIPVYAFLFLPVRIAAAGDATGFLERAAKLQWGTMLCIYAVSHAPALIKLPLPDAPGAGLRLLVFLVTVMQVADLVRRLVDTAAGTHPVARTLSETCCWEGMLAGWLAAAVAGLLIAPATPFGAAAAVLMALAAVLMGSFGELCYAAICRDRNRQGIIVTAGASMLERGIALCFAAPVFFHLTRYFFLTTPLAGF